MVDFTRLRVAVLATHGFEELELTEPVRAVRQAGAKVEIIAPASARDESPRLGIAPGRILGFRHFERRLSVPVDLFLDSPAADPANYDGLILPGGALNADQMRADHDVIRFVREMHAFEKPMGIICHAPWILISAGIVRGRKVTSYHTIQDDLRNAGGEWIDQSAVIEGHWVTSRSSGDLAVFNSSLLELLSRPQPMMSEETRIISARARIA